MSTETVNPQTAAAIVEVARQAGMADPQDAPHFIDPKDVKFDEWGRPDVVDLVAALKIAKPHLFPPPAPPDVRKLSPDEYEAAKRKAGIRNYRAISLSGK